MSRISAFPCLLCVMAFSASPPAQIAVSNAAAAPGQVAVVFFTLAATTEPLSGVQLDLKYDGSLMHIEMALGDAAQASGKGLYVHDIDSNTKRLVVVGTTGDSLREGIIAVAAATIEPHTVRGTYALAATNVVATTGDGNQASATAVPGSITILPRRRFASSANRRSGKRAPP